MAACGILEHLFENPLPPESPTLLESLSSPWKHMKSKSISPIDDHSSFTEIFGELHFKENMHDHVSHTSSSSNSISSSPLSSSLSSSSDGISFPSLSPRPGIDIPKCDVNGSHQEKYNKPYTSNNYSQKKQYSTHSDSFSSMNSESLSMCTEGLGFESFDDVDDLSTHSNDTWQQHQEEKKKNSCTRNDNVVENNHHHDHMMKRSRTNRGDFPPPISCIGRSGKPWVCFKSFREDGRFILKEIRIPTQEFLHACRENGRLRLNFIHSDDELLEEDDDADEDDENGEDSIAS